MKYEPDIARQILKAMEDHPKDPLPYKTTLISDLDDRLYHYHCRLLSEAGYISVIELRMLGGPNYYWPRELKYAGVQFLQMFEDESVWHSAKMEAKTKGVGLALDTLMKIGTELMVKMISGQVTT